MRVVFLGTPDFAVESLDAICHSSHEVVAVVTVPDRQAGRGQKLTFSPVKQYALDHNLPLLQPDKLRDPDFINALHDYRADVFCVVAFRMLPEVVWSMPKHGTFNLHASLLPAYRGAAPINWAIINGEHETGITTFRLNHQIDEGEILLQERTTITSDDNAGTLHDRLAAMGRTLVVQTLNGLADGSITARPQPPIDDPHRMLAPKIFANDRKIDFNQPAARIVDFVRGMAPYPSAYMELINEKGDKTLCKVFEVQAEYTTSVSVGSIISNEKDFIKVGTTDGFVNILALQMSGKKKNNVKEFLLGNTLKNCKIAN